MSRGVCGIVCSDENASLPMLRFASRDNFNFAPARGFEYHGNRRAFPLQLCNYHDNDADSSNTLTGWGKEFEENGFGVCLNKKKGEALSDSAPLRL